MTQPPWPDNPLNRFCTVELGPTPYTRHGLAVQITNGVSNPVALAAELTRALRQVRAEGGNDAIADDPAIFLMLHQLNFICGFRDNDQRYLDAYTECAFRQPQRYDEAAQVIAQEPVPALTAAPP